MRTAPRTDENFTKSSVLDWRESPASVLETIDAQLAEHGLEIVMIDTGSDEYEWLIEKRQETAAIASTAQPK